MSLNRCSGCPCAEDGHRCRSLQSGVVPGKQDWNRDWASLRGPERPACHGAGLWFRPGEGHPGTPVGPKEPSPWVEESSSPPPLCLCPLTHRRRVWGAEARCGYACAGWKPYPWGGQCGAGASRALLKLLCALPHRPLSPELSTSSCTHFPGCRARVFPKDCHHRHPRLESEGLRFSV